MRSLIYHGGLDCEGLSERLKGGVLVREPEEGHVEVVWGDGDREREVWERLEVLRQLVEEGVVMGAVCYAGEVEDVGSFCYWEGLFMDGVVEGWVGTQVDRRLMGEVFVNGEARAMYELGEREDVEGVVRVEAGRVLGRFLNGGEEAVHLHVWGEAGMGKTTLKEVLLEGHVEVAIIEFDVGAGGERRWWEQWTGVGSGRTLEGLVARLDEGLRFKGVEVMVVDNFQWIDAQSLRMLEILFEVRGGGLRLVTFGRVELAGGSPVVEDGGFVSHGLTGFDLDQVKELMGLCGVEGEGLAEEILLYSGGHPLLARELVANPGVLRQLRDEDGGGATGERGRFDVLLEAIFEKNPELREVGEGDLRKLVRLVAEGRVGLSEDGLRGLIERVGFEVDVESFVALDFVSQVDGRYGFRHDFYRQCLMAVMESCERVECLAEVMEMEAEAAEAGRLWELCGEDERAAGQYLVACRHGDVKCDYGRMGVWAERGGQVDGWKRREFYYYLGKSEVRVGILGEAVGSMRSYLEAGGVSPRRWWLWLYGLFFVRTRWSGRWMKLLRGRDAGEARRDVQAYGVVIEYLGIAGAPVETLEYLMGYFLVAADGDGDDAALAEIYGLLAIIYRPVLGAGGVRRFQLESLMRSRGGMREARLSARFLRFHLRMHGEGWKGQVGIGRRLVKTGVERRDYRNAARACLEYVVCLLCLDRHEEAEGFLDDFLGRCSVFLPDWFEGWFEAVRCGIWIDCCEPARVLMGRDGEMEDELRGGKHLYYAGAEMGMGNVERARWHFTEALGTKEQLRVNHHAFSLCLAVFCEVGLFLFMRGVLDENVFKKTRRMMRVQRRSVARSVSMVDGYLALDALFCGRVGRGLRKLRRAWRRAGERGEVRTERLLGYHLEMAAGGDVVCAGRDGMGERVRTLWDCVDEARLARIIGMAV